MSKIIYNENAIKACLPRIQTVKRNISTAYGMLPTAQKMATILNIVGIYKKYLNIRNSSLVSDVTNALTTFCTLNSLRNPENEIANNALYNNGSERIQALYKTIGRFTVGHYGVESLVAISTSISMIATLMINTRNNVLNSVNSNQSNCDDSTSTDTIISNNSQTITGQKIATYAKEVASRTPPVKYIYGGINLSTGVDCAGLVYRVFRDNGIQVQQLGATGYYNICEKIDAADVQPGDLVFFQGTYDTPNPVSHVGIYVGDGKMVHASSGKEEVCEVDLNTNYYKNHFLGYGRIQNI